MSPDTSGNSVGDVSRHSAAVANPVIDAPKTFQIVGSTKYATIASGVLSSIMPKASPQITPINWATTALPSATAPIPQPPSPPAAIATRLAAAAITTLAATEATAITTPAANLATSTRPRTGTSVKVVCAVRCDHSLVTVKMPSTGNSMLTGNRLPKK